MKPFILLLCLLCSASTSAQTPWWWYHKHKSENKIAQMTPSKRVDEFVDEHFHHRWDVLDEQGDLIENYILLDGTKSLPRIIEKINEYAPSRRNVNKETRYWRFEACWFLLSSMDNKSFRLRASEEGKYAIDALEHSVERMRLAGFAAQENSYNGIFTMVGKEVENEMGINWKDKSIQDTFRFRYSINLSDTELIGFINYLTQHYPEYPSWSKGKLTKDDTDIAPSGYPARNVMLEKPERFHDVYLEFKKQNENTSSRYSHERN